MEARPSQSMRKSQVKKRRTTDAVQGFEAFLECPVCMACPILPPIMQCPNGHVVCQACASQCTCCPTCRAEPVNIRNLLAEKMAEHHEFHCPFAPHCKFTAKYSGLPEHVDCCEFKPFACPALNPCGHKDIVMDPDLIVEHLHSLHNIPIVDASAGNEAQTATWHVVNPDEVELCKWDGIIIRACGGNFLGQFQATEEGESLGYMAWLQFIGPKCSSLGFQYDVSVSSRKRKVLFQGLPQPINMPSNYVPAVYDCLFIPRNLAHLMSESDDDTLNVKVDFNIWQSSQAD